MNNTTQEDRDKIWQEILESIKVSVSPAIFSTWLSRTHLANLTRGESDRFMAQVGCSSSFVKATVEKRYFGLIQDSLAKSVNAPCDLAFIVKQNSNILPPIPAKEPLFQNQEESPNIDLVEKLSLARIRPGFTFENFAVSASNQMAHAAAEAVAAKPGSAYNPLFLWGGVGVGKSHLMLAVGYSVLQKNPDAKVFFCSGEEFTNDIIQGIRNKTTESFRNKYRKLNTLLIDDIQFIAGKDAVQEEFFHTFNAVTSVGGQIILTSDRPPSEISKLEERLRSRFEAGLIVDISAPDFELRCAIIQIKMKEQGIELEMDIVQMIAANVDSARKIQGFLTRLVSEAKLRNLPIDESLVKNMVGKGSVENADPQRRLTADEVIDTVCAHFSVSKKAIMGQARARIIARPRQVLMYLLRTQAGLPLQEVGRIIGGRDHSTVMHAVGTITRLATTDVKIRADLVGIKNSLRG